METDTVFRVAATLLGFGVNVIRKSGSILWRLEALLKGVQFEGRVALTGRPIISLAKNSNIIIGDNVHVASSLRANPLGCFQPCVLRTLGCDAQLILHDDVGLSGAVVCAGRHIEIGRGTIIGSGAMILDNDFHVLENGAWRSESVAGSRSIKIGEYVFIGARAIILKGVTLGDFSIVGAGAVVTKDVPPKHLAIGNPASIIPLKRLSEDTSVT